MPESRCGKRINQNKQRDQSKVIKNMKLYFSTMRCLVAVLCAGLFNVACSAEPSPLQLAVTGYNHTEKEIGFFTVGRGDGKGGDGTEVGYLGPGTGGGGETCCILAPAVWPQGMTVKVTWESWTKSTPQTLTRVVPVPKYDAKDASTLDVHFLHNGEVKVFVTKYMLGHRDYPLKGKEAEMKPGVPVKIIWP
jgi:hypothetical protein